MCQVAITTDQIDVFTTETSCLTIVWATIQDIRLHKISMECCLELVTAASVCNQPEWVVWEGVFIGWSDSSARVRFS
jgi:hypothetical protein